MENGNYVDVDPLGCIARIADYSSRSCLVVAGEYSDKAQGFARSPLFIFVVVDKDKESPHPKFAKLGGFSDSVRQHLISLVHERPYCLNVQDTFGNNLIIVKTGDGDVTIATSSNVNNTGAIFTIFPNEPLYPEIQRLYLLIQEENHTLKNRVKNGVHLIPDGLLQTMCTIRDAWEKKSST